MPTNTQRVVGAIASIGITVGGAWLASKAHSDLASTAQAEFPNGVSLTFKNVRNAKGNIVVMVFDNRDAFKSYDYSRAVRYAEVAARHGDVAVTFPDLRTGPLAIAAFHDEDKDQDLNMEGDWPSEGYATSGALDAYDTPTFRGASLSNSDVTITMYYAN
ncbi:MAG: DUF2141 domain-containing protein [Pseudomonadota bacterium]